MNSTLPDQKIPKHKLEALTGCRFFAAMAVVAFHFLPGSLQTNGIVRDIATHGYVAVSFFFALSGFVLTYNFANLKFEEKGRFWLARFARIYPIYFIALLMGGATTLYFRHLGDLFITTRQWGLGGLLSVFCLQAWIPETALSWNYPGWTLSCEAFFYASFPLVIQILRPLKTRAIAITGAVCWLLALAAPTAYMMAGPFVQRTGWGDQSIRTLDDLLISFSPLMHIPSFIFGMAGGLLFVRGRAAGAAASQNGKRWLNDILLVLSFAAALLVLHLNPNRMLLNNGLLLPIFGVIIYWLACGRSQVAALLGSLPLRVLGDASYAMYILQVPVFFSTRYLMRIFHLPYSEVQQSAAYLGSFVTALILVSIASSTLVEPFIRVRVMNSITDRIAILQARRLRAA